jgi:hypothetical protein
MAMQCIPCEVGIELLNVIYVNFKLQRIKKIYVLKFPLLTGHEAEPLSCN